VLIRVWPSRSAARLTRWRLASELDITKFVECVTAGQEFVY
jgi:hypothetical protein